MADPSEAAGGGGGGEEKKTRMQKLAGKIPSSQQGLYLAKLEEEGVRLEDTSMSISGPIRVFKVPRLDEHVDVDAMGPGSANHCRRSRYASGTAEAEDASAAVGDCDFTSDEQLVLADIVRLGNGDAESSHGVRAFVRGGMRQRLVWADGEAVAAVVTCGGLCPGLNDVVVEIVNTLYYHYSVDTVYGIRMGMRGFHDPEYEPWRKLHPDELGHKVHQGGTFLGSSRGGFDAGKIADALVRHGVNQVYIVGGDGTHRAALRLSEEIARRRLKIAVAAVPKTIDNDCGVIDSSFGHKTSINESVKAIRSARVEADCTPNGVGIVKLMGRESGFIAAHATLASREADLCLVPEVPMVLDGPHGVLAYLEECVKRRGSAVVVVAEGAGAHLFDGDANGRDESGNRKLGDIGGLLKDRVKRHFEKAGTPASIKYHDPSYMIRSVPASPSDSIYCTILAQNAVHGAMAGFTAFTSAVVNYRTVFLPISLICATSPCRLNPVGRTWGRVVSTTHQPKFYEEEEK